MKNNIYISGDSFCFDRYSYTNNHDAIGWPAMLADKLNLNLTGEGFAGRGFWNVRLHLIEYLNSKNYDNTDLFILCHTNPDRLLHRSYARSLINIPYDAIPVPPNNKEIVEMYDKYIYEEEIHSWAMKRWLIELGTLLEGKPVIHLFCFPQTSMLAHIPTGFKLRGSLHYKAREIGIKNGFDYTKINQSELPNHFPVDTNIKIANDLANYYINEISISPNQTKYFDIDI
jgi:hypothetical protein